MIWQTFILSNLFAWASILIQNDREFQKEASPLEFIWSDNQYHMKLLLYDMTQSLIRKLTS